MMLPTKTCINCSAQLTNRFCAACGQKADVHRLSLLHFFTHDIIHSFWHVEKGIFFNFKELFTRPGFAARDYISGKRVRYFSFFTLLLLVIGAVLFANHYVDADREFVVITNSGKRLDATIVSNLKFILLAYIPLLALASAIYFKRLKFWFSEHLVANTFFFSGVLIIYFLGFLISKIFSQYDYWLENLKIIFPIVYLCICYYQFTYKAYSFLGFTWRMTGLLILFSILFAVLFFFFYNFYDMRSFSFEYKS